ncbi:hypothetical protein GQ55_7G284100 [Panicum hallii var. hallii]|uniref:GIR1-like zinc ribbon domain-containing protein n=1 Tax=Panicum hallii var. hallii TaxID=1504633 RepID=A0A2T7CZZ5_9POAL|nr:hypothetical protein GQ55_7G284100 [Panicum hallii var. hallii]
MAADVSSVARLLRGEAGKKGGPEIVTMDLLSSCGGGGAAEDEVVDLEVSVPAGFERRLDLLSGRTFLTPRHPSVLDGHQDLNLPPPGAPAAAPPTTSAAVCTLDMVRSALERAAAGRTAASPATSTASSASTSSSSSSAGKRIRSPPTTATPAMRAAACPSCLTYVLIAEEDPRCPRCAARVPPLRGKSASSAAGDGCGKKPRIDLNAAADETE